MKDYFPPKPLDYPGFVEDLRDLLDEAGSLEAIGTWSPDDNSFRRWRSKLIDLLVRISKAGYMDVRCEVEDRAFKYCGPGDDKYAAKVFEQAVDDTMIELQLIVDNFVNHGAPKAEASEVNEEISAPVAAPLAVPEKVTIPWVLKNTPASVIWGALVTALTTLAATFMVGLAAGGTSFGQALIAKFTPSTTATAPASLTVPSHK